jgi:hypothetical protein
VWHVLNSIFIFAPLNNFVLHLVCSPVHVKVAHFTAILFLLFCISQLGHRSLLDTCTKSSKLLAFLYLIHLMDIPLFNFPDTWLLPIYAWVGNIKCLVMYSQVSWTSIYITETFILPCFCIVIYTKFILLSFWPLL